MKTGTKNSNIAELYSRIPDYSQVKHLGNSDFIRTLEELKEDFRECRASLHEVDSDVEYITEQTRKILNISKDDGYACQLNNKPGNITLASTNRAILSGINYLPAISNNASEGQNRIPSSSFLPHSSDPEKSYLSVKSCSLSRNPKTFIPCTPIRIDRRRLEGRAEGHQGSSYAEDLELCSRGGSSSPDSLLSKWSSSPEIHVCKGKEFRAPAHTENRALARRSRNNSAPSIPDLEKPRMYFKAHPVPSHVHKPLYEYLMLKNKRRSLRVCEASKQKLLAQVKPFSFASDSKQRKGGGGGTQGQVCERAEELLNNARPTKKRNNPRFGFRTNRLDHYGFKANPAPPRTRALLSAIKLKEQQEYRELKKKLRAEALMKSASLPPSMAARDRRTKSHFLKMEELLSRYNAQTEAGCSRRTMRGSSTDTWTDEDQLSDEDLLFAHPPRAGRRGGGGAGAKVPCSRMLRGHFTPYGRLPFPTSSATGRIFESTSNDNHASRLRVQTAKAREQNRMKSEEEELTRLMRMEKKRQELRDAHMLAWRRAGSYSSSQDIALRRQMRLATAILERESYRRDMQSMLNRVRSAPLLLEGQERKGEPGRKRREDNSGRSKSPNKLSSPRYTARQYASNRLHWSLAKEETDKSETAAMAEGSLTNSDNESVRNLDLDMDDDPEEDRDKDKNSKQDQTCETPLNGSPGNSVHSLDGRPPSSGGGRKETEEFRDHGDLEDEDEDHSEEDQ